MKPNAINQQAADLTYLRSRTFRVVAKSLLSCLAAVLLTSPVGAQTVTTTGVDGYLPAEIAPGSPASSYALSNIFTLNYFTGNLHVNIPFLTVSGRGQAHVPIGLSIDSARYIQDNYGPNYCYQQGPPTMCHSYGVLPVGLPTVNVSPSPSIGTGLTGVYYGRGLLQITYSDNVKKGVVASAYAVTRVTFYSPDGTSTELVDTNYFGSPVLTTCNWTGSDWSSGCQQMANRGTTFVSHDGSHIRFVCNTDIHDAVNFGSITSYVPDGTVYFSDGESYAVSNGGQVGTVEDSNGNVVSVAAGQVTSSSGQQVTISSTVAADLSTASETISYVGYAGQSRAITVRMQDLSTALANGYTMQPFRSLYPSLTYDVIPSFGSQVPQCCFANAIASVTLADQKSQYLFQYNSYGELASITLPTGGQYQFAWGTTDSNLPDGADWSMLQIHRGVTDIWDLPDGKTVTRHEHISYSTVPSSGIVTTSTEYDGSNNLLKQTVHNFYLVMPQFSHDPLGHDSWADGREYETDTYDPNGRLLGKVVHNWNQAGPLPWPDTTIPWYGPTNTQMSYNPRETEVDTTNDAGQVSQTKRQYDGYNNITDNQDFDWSSGSSATLLRHSVIKYQTAPSYVNAGLIRLPVEEMQEDSQGNVLSDTQFTYDNQTVVDDPNIVNHDSAYGASSTNPRGNLTQRKEMLSGAATQMTYDVAGHVLTFADPNNNVYHLSYADNYSDGQTRNSYAHVTTLTNPAGQVQTWQWDFNLGLPVLHSDVNGVRTATAFADPLDRLTQTITGRSTPVETHTNVLYASPTDIHTFKDQNSTGESDSLSGGLHVESQYDGFGRISSSLTYENSTQYIITNTQYDALGRVYEQKNPSRPGDSLDFPTIFTYDALGRPTGTLTADGAQTTTAYLGNQTTVTDAAGHVRQTVSDAAGRLVRVIEDPAGLNYQTTYAYDALDNLTQVNQSSLIRTFTYDSLNHLLSATNPETGTILYGYDPNGNLISKVDARNITTAFTYDNLNRLTLKAYSDGTPGVVNTYDTPNVPYSVGRLTRTANDASVSTYNAFDPLGRLLASTQQTSGETYSFAYSYNLAGELTTETYPSGRKVVTCYDPANRVSSVQSGGNCLSSGSGTLYVSNIQYTPHGQPDSMLFGNGLLESTGFNSRLQLQSRTLAAVNGSNFWALSNVFATTGADNNGNLLQQFITAPGMANPIGETFLYDGVNRLALASEGSSNVASPSCPDPGAQWCQAFSYDQMGNRSVGATSNVTELTPSSFNPATNQIADSGWQYDLAGNVSLDPTMPGGTSYKYDAENRLVAVCNAESASACANQPAGNRVLYTYDAQGHRVSKISFSQAPTLYVYDASGSLSAEYGLSTAPTHTLFATTDHLGSTRVITDENANVVSRQDDLPFGESMLISPGNPRYEIAGYGQDASVTLKFTGKERDTESGLDYMEARYYGSSMGRMMSPDPVFISIDRIRDPQGLNLYAYARNNPLSITDPTGLDFYQTCTSTKDNGDTCQQVQNGSSKVWVQGTSDSSGFTANRIANDADGNLVDTAHGNAAVSGSFDENGVHLNGAQGQFIDGSAQTNVNGSGIFSGIQGQFVSDCGGSCQGRAELVGSDQALSAMEGALNRQGGLTSALDLLSGAHNPGTQWKDSDGYIHVILNGDGTLNAGKTEMHFEGHPTGVDVTKFVLHMVDTIRDATSGRAAAEKSRVLP